MESGLTNRDADGRPDLSSTDTVKVPLTDATVVSVTTSIPRPWVPEVRRGLPPSGSHLLPIMTRLSGGCVVSRSVPLDAPFVF